MGAGSDLPASPPAICPQSDPAAIRVGIALTVVMIFSAAMSWVRQYLVLRTVNRVDAVLEK